ncbi:MAG TPA: ferritin-like domain-containing protein [Polyangiaceae bacterium]|jgi:1,2-phenylacetyl-CoA epoxidase catalytic subunit|nr:ferritin-like domain-containing protein [Polyangiaceae bacterium]
MNVEAFLAELDAQNAAALARIAVAAAREPAADLTVARLLVLALKNELEATECAAGWIASTPEIDVKLALARQAGDEAKHFRLIEKRLAELGAAPVSYEAGPRSPLLQYLSSLEGTVERVAAGQFTREALAVVRNEEFVRFCVSRGDEATAALYRDVIQPDEHHHHELGRQLLSRLATTNEAQAAARRASARTLELAEELQEIARLKLGVSRAPGC